MTAHPPPAQPWSWPEALPTPLSRPPGARDAAGRTDADLAAGRADPRSRVLVLHGDAAPLTSDRLALHLVTPTEVPDGAQWMVLGRRDGVAVLGAAFPADADEPVPADRWARLREVGGELDRDSAGLFVQALALGQWLIGAPHCAACGTRTHVENGGWSRRCPCGREHFPRTDPAVIVAVESADGERLLLGSNAMWGQGRYSCFAGFVEAGESLEATVEREIAEECGIRVAHVAYRGSQAWPYPRSLMLGFRARAARDDDARADGDEIVQVRWFTRDQMRAALAGESDATMPGAASIARSLIVDWLENPAGTGTGRS
ncbi:MAG: NAD(+) diphosphatase [Microbacterium sp.]|uniref:NAD(+) diphosphatase n=1 Tax=Microbacterium sp. TaxID=51671 RepID=UPI003A88195F